MYTNPKQTGDDGAYEQALRDRGKDAFHDGKAKEAYGDFTASVLSEAIRWFREEGVTFTKPPGAITPSELVAGLAVAANAELRERGDDASNRLSAATWLFSAVAELRSALDEETPTTADGISERVAELILRGVTLGQIDMIMRAIDLGWLDKLAEHEVDRARRSAGATVTNVKKATIKEEAMGEALRIAGKNQTLSNEEIAVKVRESLRIATTVKTLTGWVRAWRQQGFMPPQKKL